MERFLGWDFEGANVKIGCITKACLHLFTTVEYTLQNTEQRQPVTKSSVKPLNSNIIIPENKFGWYWVHNNCTNHDILIKDSSNCQI